jgi:hypothetical protein
MSRKLRVEISGVCMGQGKPCRFLYDAATDVLLGDVCKAYGENRLWHVGHQHGEPVPERDRHHPSFAAAMAFAKAHFGKEE